MIASSATEPTTIPAIAPPDRPFFDVEAAAVGVLDEEADVGEGVLELVANVIYAVIVGSTTPAQRWSTPELKQHVSVLFCPPEEQN